MAPYNDESIDTSPVNKNYLKIVNELAALRDKLKNELPFNQVQNLLGDWVDMVVEYRSEHNFETYAFTVKTSLLQVSQVLNEFKTILDSYATKLCQCEISLT